MTVLLSLVDFHTASDEELAGNHDEGLPGYGAGFAAGHAAARQEAASLETEFIKALDDIAFSYAEARRAVLQDLTPLFETIVERLCPLAAGDVFRAHALKALADAADADTDGPLCLYAHPEDTEALRGILNTGTVTHIDLIPDHTFPRHRLHIATAKAASTLDVTELLTSLETVLRSLVDINESEREHG